jgi:hypothetical protein
LHDGFSLLPLPLAGGGLGWGCRRESHCPCGESFPHPPRAARGSTSPASGRGKQKRGNYNTQPHRISWHSTSRSGSESPRRRAA